MSVDSQDLQPLADAEPQAITSSGDQRTSNIKGLSKLESGPALQFGAHLHDKPCLNIALGLEKQQVSQLLKLVWLNPPGQLVCSCHWVHHLNPNRLGKARCWHGGHQPLILSPVDAATSCTGPRASRALLCDHRRREGGHATGIQLQFCVRACRTQLQSSKKPINLRSHVLSIFLTFDPSGILAFVRKDVATNPGSRDILQQQTTQAILHAQNPHISILHRKPHKAKMTLGALHASVHYHLAIQGIASSHEVLSSKHM